MIPFLHVYLQICFDCANRKLRLKEIHCSREKNSLHHVTFELSFSACLFFYLFIFVIVYCAFVCFLLPIKVCTKKYPMCTGTPMAWQVARSCRDQGESNSQMLGKI